MSNWPSNFSNIVVVLVFECRHGLAGDLANQPSNVDVSPKLGASVETFITFSENFNQSLERMTFPQSAANIVYLCMYYSEGSCPVCIYVDWHVRACYVFVHVLGWVCCALHSVVLSHLTCFGFKDGNGYRYRYPMFSCFCVS